MSCEFSIDCQWFRFRDGFYFFNFQCGIQNHEFILIGGILGVGFLIILGNQD